MMPPRLRAWLERLPIADPVQRRKGSLLQLFLLGGNFSVLFFLIFLMFLLQPEERTMILIASAISLIGYSGALVILRRGSFQKAVLFAGTGIVFAGLWVLLSVGIQNGLPYFTAFLIPITFVGLLAGRRSMLNVTLACYAGILVILGLEHVAPTLTGYVQTSNSSTYVVLLFLLLTSLIVLCFHQFGFTLEDALTQALTRQRDLEALQATLEQRVAERTNDLAIANQQLLDTNQLLTKANTVAEEASSLKTAFLANMSHELRTPLNAIINYTHFLANPAAGDNLEDQRMYLDRVRANADHLLGLINDILDLSKIEAGHISLVLEAVVLPTLLQSVATTAQSLLTTKPVTLRLEVDPGLPMLMLDKTRIRQVLLNLLSNAAKFTEQGTITVHGAVHGDQVELAVKDTGVGIPTDAQQRVFEEFQQVDHALNRTYAGTGLGLPISKRLVELHGGSLTLISTVGVGSTFTVRLPIHAPLPVTLPGAVVADPQIVVQPSILVVDDDPDTHMVLRRILEGAGYQVRGVEDSRMVISSLHAQRPNLIILDIRMPHLDGWAVLRQIRAEPQFQDLPVILCSMVDAEPTLIGLLGIADYLVKPIRSEDVLAAVLHWITPAQTVLIIDDDPDVRTTTSRALAQAELRVLTAASGAEGVRLAVEELPGVIILDLMMPEMDGFQVITVLQQNPVTANIPLIVMTAKDLTVEEQGWLRTRAITALQKTQVESADLPTYLTSILNQKG